MGNNKIQKNILPVVFEEKEVRRAWFKEQWFFVVEDVVQVLIDSTNSKNYIQKMKQRDKELSQGWGQIVHTLNIFTKGGIQKMNCANLGGI